MFHRMSSPLLIAICAYTGGPAFRLAAFAEATQIRLGDRRSKAQPAAQPKAVHGSLSRTKADAAQDDVRDSAIEETDAGFQAYLATRDAEVSAQWARMVDDEDEVPWRPAAEQGPGEGYNLCYNGKQLPDFYVLGVQKCATSTLAANLMGAGMPNIHGLLNPKEFHFFDHRMDLAVEGEEGINANRDKLLRWMPSCPSGGPRLPLADFTPDYLRMVPRPSTLTPIGDWGSEHDISLPEKLGQIYGSMGEKLQFGIMIREPLAQMQSAWYHAASFDFTNACSSCAAPSFREALQSLLDGMRSSPPAYTAWLWTTMYATQIEEWLTHFSASQFYIIPTNVLAGGDKDSICRDIVQRLNYKMECDSQGVQSPHEWSHEHPPVDEDAGPELRAAFDEVMANEKARLIGLLTKAHVFGMGLANYQGAPGDEGAVGRWLMKGW